MVSHDIVEFSTKLPDIESIIRCVSTNTGLIASYDYNKHDLLFKEFNKKIGLYEGIGMSYYITIFDVFDKETNYLVDATIYSLVQLGGNYLGTLPEWAGLNWDLARLLI